MKPLERPPSRSVRGLYRRPSVIRLFSGVRITLHAMVFRRRSDRQPAKALVSRAADAPVSPRLQAAARAADPTLPHDSLEPLQYETAEAGLVGRGEDCVSVNRSYVILKYPSHATRSLDWPPERPATRWSASIASRKCGRRLSLACHPGEPLERPIERGATYSRRGGLQLTCVRCEPLERPLLHADRSGIKALGRPSVHGTDSVGGRRQSDR